MSTIDEALELLAGHGPAWRITEGFANHGPMAAEALVTLGRSEDVVPWVESYVPNLGPPLPNATPIADAWQDGLGDHRQMAAFAAQFERELADEGYVAVLQRWIPRLAPGLSAAAAHGLIRSAHAVRSLDQEANEARLAELAQGLAYWAGAYRRVGAATLAAGDTAGDDSSGSASAAIGRVQRVSVARGGSIVAAVEQAGADASFDGVLTLAGPGSDESAFLSDLTATMAGVELINARAGNPMDIAFIHALTGPSSLRLFAHHLPPTEVRRAMRYAWELAAAIYAAYSDIDIDGRIASEQGESGSDEPIEPADLISRAVATGDEHAIKYTEACLREHAIAPNRVYLAAAAAAVDAMARA